MNQIAIEMYQTRYPSNGANTIIELDYQFEKVIEQF